MKRGRKQRLKSGDEWDAIHKVPLCLFYNITGLKKRVKTILNKRARKEAKDEFKRGAVQDNNEHECE